MSRKPDYNLKVLNKQTEGRCVVGAGWSNDDGSISITLNPCVVLQADSDIVINLFPNNEEYYKKKGKGKGKTYKVPAEEDLENQEDIPY